MSVRPDVRPLPFTKNRRKLQKNDNVDLENLCDCIFCHWEHILLRTRACSFGFWIVLYWSLLYLFVCLFVYSYKCKSLYLSFPFFLSFLSSFFSKFYCAHFHLSYTRYSAFRDLYFRWDIVNLTIANFKWLFEFILHSKVKKNYEFSATEQKSTAILTRFLVSGYAIEGYHCKILFSFWGIKLWKNLCDRYSIFFKHQKRWESQNPLQINHQFATSIREWSAELQ